MVAARPDGGEIRWSKLGTSLPVANIQALVASAGELTADQIERYVQPDIDAHAVLPEHSDEVPVIDLSNLLSPESVEAEVAKLRFACAEWGFFQAGSSSGEGWGGKRQRWRGAGLDQAPGRLAPGQTRVALPTEAARERSGGRGHEEAAWDLSSSTHSWSRRSTPRSTELEEEDLNRITAGGSGDAWRGSWQEGNAWRGSWLEGNARRWSWSERKAPARFLSGGGVVPGRHTSWAAQVKNPTTTSLATRIIAQVQAGGSDGIRGVGGGRRRNQRRKWAHADGRRRNQLGGACPGDARGRWRKKMGSGIYLRQF